MRRVGTLALLALAAFARADDLATATTAVADATTTIQETANAAVAPVAGAAAGVAKAGEEAATAVTETAEEVGEAVAKAGEDAAAGAADALPKLDAVPGDAQSLTGAASGALTDAANHLATAGSHTASDGATVLVLPTLKQLTAIVKNDKEATAANGMGCYTVGDSDNQLSLLLCENEGSAQTVAKTEGGLDYAWVKGKVTNTGTTDLCQVSFSTATQDLHLKALDQLPLELPVVTPTKLAAGETIDFSFLLPIDKALTVPSAPFVGLADTLAPCDLLKASATDATDAATAAVDAAAAAPAAATDAATKAAAEAAAAAEAIANVVVDPSTSIPKASDIIQAQVQDTTVDKEAISPAAKASASLVGVLTIAALVAAQLLL